MDSARLVDFLFEAMMLKRTPRSGYQFLGAGSESVAEHSLGVLFVSFALAKLRPEADVEKILKLAMFHDLPEARTGDLNYMNKRYVSMDEDKAMEDAAHGLSFGDELKELWREWRECESLEARLAADADQLDMVLELRRLNDLGSVQAKDWLFYAEKRLRTDEAKIIFQQIMKSDPNGWWFERRDDYWVRPNAGNK